MSSEKKKIYDKQYRLANKDKAMEYRKQYNLNNVEKIAEYRQTENRKKSYRITNWKRLGVISENFNELYEKYINTNNCEECNVELIYGMCGSNKKVLDHDHTTGKFRNILCHCCNVRRK
jgi:hypothetical protein